MSDDSDSTVIDLAGLIGRIANGAEGEQNVRDGIERVLPPGVDPSALDNAALAGALSGLQLAASQRSHGAREEDPAPTVRSREVEHPDGTTVGIRVYVPDEDAHFRKTDDGLSVAVSGHTVTVPTPFTVSEIDVVENGTDYTEAIAHAATMLPGNDPSAED